MKHKAIRWIIAFAILIAIPSKIWFFGYNPYFELVNLDLVHYGILFFLMNMIAWFFSAHAYILEEKTSERFCVLAMILLIGLPIVLMGTFISKIMISMILIHNIVRGFTQPFLEGFVNHRIENDEARATIISVKSAFVGLGSLVALFLFSNLIKIRSLPFSLQVLGYITLLSGIVLIFQYAKIPKATKSPC